MYLQRNLQGIGNIWSTLSAHSLPHFIPPNTEICVSLFLSISDIGYCFPFVSSVGRSVAFHPLDIQFRAISDFPSVSLLCSFSGVSAGVVPFSNWTPEAIMYYTMRWSPMILNGTRMLMPFQLILSLGQNVNFSMECVLLCRHNIFNIFQMDIIPILCGAHIFFLFRDDKKKRYLFQLDFRGAQIIFISR